MYTCVRVYMYESEYAWYIYCIISMHYYLRNAQVSGKKKKPVSGWDTSLEEVTKGQSNQMTRCKKKTKTMKDGICQHRSKVKAASLRSWRMTRKEKTTEELVPQLQSSFLLRTDRKFIFELASSPEASGCNLTTEWALQVISENDMSLLMWPQNHHVELWLFY